MNRRAAGADWPAATRFSWRTAFIIRYMLPRCALLWSSLIVAGFTFGQARPARPRIVSALPVTGPARIIFSDRFPGSHPVWFEVRISADGQGCYGSQATAGQPREWLRFQAAPASVARIFAWARALDYFRRPRLEARARVGFMGEKRLQYRGLHHQGAQQFNYTQVRLAARLTSWFEGVSQTGEHRLRLRRALRYDPLGVLSELDQIRRDWRDHDLAAPELLSPLLLRIAGDDSMMQIARMRARGLLRAFRRGKG